MRKKALKIFDPTKIDDKVTFTSGAQSSEIKNKYYLLPFTFVDRVTKRFTEGSVKYSDYNYRKGFNDKAFVLDRINHMFEHMYLFLSYNQDDNLAAIGWAVAFLMELESTDVGKEILYEIRDEMNIKNP